jgi:hypothetical protein
MLSIETFQIIAAIVGLEFTLISVIVAMSFGWFKLSTRIKATDDNLNEALKGIESLTQSIDKFVNNKNDFQDHIKDKLIEYDDRFDDQESISKKQIDKISNLNSDLKIQNVSLGYMKDLFDDNKRISINTADAINKLANAISKMEPILDLILSNQKN